MNTKRRFGVIRSGGVPGVPSADWESLSPVMFDNVERAIKFAASLDHATVVELLPLVTHLAPQERS